MWVSLPSDHEVKVQIKPYSHAMLTASQDIAYIQQSHNEFINLRTYQTYVKDAILDTLNAIGFPTLGTFVDQLSPKDVRYLYTKIMEISSISRTQLEALETMLDIQFNKQFSEDSWNCTICREKKLDYARGCGYLPKDKRDPKPFLPRVGNKIFTECPISTMEPYAMNQASMAYKLLDAGVLPEDGGIGAQTEWFVKASLLYKRKIAEAERDSIEASRKK